MMMLVCLLRQKFKKLRFQMIDDNSTGRPWNNISMPISGSIFPTESARSVLTDSILNFVVSYSEGAVPR
jgi:hypothetical protein